MSASERIRELRRARPRSRFLRASVALLAAMVAFAWLSGEVAADELFSERRAANLRRFLTQDALPYPLRAEGFSWSGLGAWVWELLAERGLEAMARTLAIAVLAIVLAGLAATLAVPFATRTLMARDPYLLLAEGARPLAWRLVTGTTRLALIALRAIPEYVWAFLLLAILGANAWPAVLALALHNAGILGRLGADTLENLETAPLRALRMAGSSRPRLVAGAVAPLATPRLLLYFFYRFETCVREATVLGMLGVVSLGYWIQDARGRDRYDVMLLFVALGTVLVLLGDACSAVARSWIRRER